MAIRCIGMKRMFGLLPVRDAQIGALTIRQRGGSRSVRDPGLGPCAINRVSVRAKSVRGSARSTGSRSVGPCAITGSRSARDQPGLGPRGVWSGLGPRGVWSARDRVCREVTRAEVGAGIQTIDAPLTLGDGGAPVFRLVRNRTVEIETSRQFLIRSEVTYQDIALSKRQLLP